MTISGKVVKEIMKEELGNITIGNNISEYSWNATDEFGDRLANGVYLYKVTVRHDGKEVKPYSTAGDASFKENIGKLYNEIRHYLYYCAYLRAQKKDF